MAQSIYVADFETRAGAKATEENKTWVWAWSICNIYEVDPDFVSTGSDIKSFFKFIRKLGDCIIYFHNLKFDGKFLLDYLVKHEYKHVTTRAEYRGDNKAFTTLIDKDGVFYNIKIHNGYRKSVEFRDSFKKAPMSVAALGKGFKTKYQKTTLDYGLDRPEGYKPTESELEYIKNDVLVMAEVLQNFYRMGYDRMTIGADAIKFYKGLMGKSSFENCFPQLDKGQDAFVRKAYKGGWCYVNPVFAGKTINEQGNTYDVNSLYPSMLSSTPYEMYGETTVNLYPCFNGEYYIGQYEFDKRKPLYVQRLKASFTVKKNHLPTIQLKNNFRYAQNEYITESEGVEELYLTCIDLEMFLQQYDVHYIEYLDGYKYMCSDTMFDDYIDNFMKIKATSTGAPRMIAKLFLNNLYGKFGQKIESKQKYPYLDEESQSVKYTLSEEEERKPLYIPIAAFCTAYSRRFTIYHAQQNIDRFCYADTDSIHLIGKPDNLLIHPTNLCSWKHESTWDKARFLRQKTYMEHIIESDEEPVDPYWDIKCAGMPNNVKEVFIKEMSEGAKTPEDFKIGLSYDNLKLRPKTVNGGVILVATPFSIKG